MSAKRDWVFLPPGYRPLFMALSTAIVALVIWDKTRSPLELSAPPNSWEGAQDDAARPLPVSQMDLSGRLSAMNAARPAATRRQEAPGKPIEVVEEKNLPNQARSEEERSAINERLYQGLEREKKRMGIVRIIEKDSERPEEAAGGADSVFLASAKVLVLKNAEALQTAWAAAGLAGAPPTVDFTQKMALFLACPPGCGIVSLRTGKKSVTVLYKESGFTDPSARVRAVAASAKPVVLAPAP